MSYSDRESMQSGNGSPEGVTTVGGGAVTAPPLARVSERERILEALERCGGNQTRAARLLGVSRRTLINRLEEYDLPRPRKRRPS